MRSQSDTKTKSMRVAWCLAMVSLGPTSCNYVSTNSRSTSCELRVAWDPYEPYSYTDEDGEPIGFDIDVVTKIADELGCSLNFAEMSWSEILVALENGSVDITIGTGYKPDRAEWSWYSDSYRDEVIGLLMREGSAADFPGDSLDQLFANGMILGKTTDDTYDAATEALFASYATQVKDRVSEESNLRRLLDGAVDAFLVEVNVAAALARRHQAVDRLEFHSLAFPAGSYRLQMSKKSVSPEQVVEINEAIQGMVASGWTISTLKTYGIR